MTNKNAFLDHAKIVNYFIDHPLLPEIMHDRFWRTLSKKQIAKVLKYGNISASQEFTAEHVVMFFLFLHWMENI